MTDEHRNDVPSQPESEEQSSGPGTPEAALTEDAGGKALADALKVSFRFLKFAMIALVAFYVLSGIFYVDPGEVKIKLSFGRPVEGKDGKVVLEPGSGWHIRWPWEEVVPIPTVEKTIDLTGEFWTGVDPMREAQALPPASPLILERDGFLITGDVNIVHMQLRARYRARSDEQGSLDYRFRVKQPEELLKRFVIQATIKTVGRMRVMDVLQERKGDVIVGIRDEVRRMLREYADANGFGLGVELTSIEYISDPTMPGKVRDAFYAYQTAGEEKSRLIREGKKEVEEIIGQARQRKAEIIAQANSYATRLREVARADAEALLKLKKAYDTSDAMAAVLRTWQYNRTVEKLLGQAKDSFFLHPSSDGSRRQLRVMLSRQVKRYGGEQGKREREAETGP